MNTMLAALRQYLTPPLLASAAQLVGEPQDKVEGAFTHILPLLLAGVAKQAGNNQTTSTLANLLQAAPAPEVLTGEITGNAAANLANDEQLMASGQQFLSTLFAKDQPDVVQKLSQVSQLKSSSISSLLQIAAPLVMGFLAQHMTKNQLSISGLLTGLQNSHIEQGLPASLGQLLTTTPTTAAAQAAATTPLVKKSALQPLIALLILGLLVLLFLKSCHQTATDPSATNLTRSDPATTPTSSTANTSTNNSSASTTTQSDKMMSLSPTDNVVSSIATGAGIASTAAQVASQSQWIAQSSSSGNAVSNIQNKLAQLGAFFTKSLPNGKSLNIPQFGVENKLLSFIENNNQTVDKTTWFSFDRLTFASGSSQLLRQSQEQLTNIALILRAYPKVNIKLGGYTDNVGNDADNLRLSQGRADSVRQALITLGVSARRITAEGYGAAHPVASNDTEQGRAQNRRIDIRVTQK